ncbi:hypothetical protein A0H81_05064 [Grifola frondosa]|uniref:Biotin carboxylase C-terminal domain-containing protein n=1 Tax=Grifola frondosa TaxID=5627 RepID=A0A1C7MDN6_GRIFR|nr:hypothetical protein A0H81_05064 [Grifola frondosa]
MSTRLNDPKVGAQSSADRHARPVPHSPPRPRSHSRSCSTSRGRSASPVPRCHNKRTRRHTPPPSNSSQTSGHSRGHKKRSTHKKRHRSHHRGSDREVALPPATAVSPTVCNTVMAAIIDAKDHKWQIRDHTSLAYQLQGAARFLFRQNGPFIHVYHVFILGLTFYGNAKHIAKAARKMPHFKDFPEKDVLIMWKAFNEFLVDVPWFTDIIPGLRDSADHTRSLCSFLEYHARAARSDDIASLKRDAHLFMEDIDLPNGVNIPAFHTDMGNKSNRGWNHVGLARLLVPRSMRDKFDEDPKKFVRKVRTGVYKITAEDYPSFMHADDGYDTSAEDKALGMGEFLLLCGRRIFTGPRSAQSEPGAQGAGRKTVAQLKNMSTVTPQNIAYTAWWNMQLFGYCEPDAHEHHAAEGRSTVVSRIAAQRAARRAAQHDVELRQPPPSSSEDEDARARAGPRAVHHTAAVFPPFPGCADDEEDDRPQAYEGPDEGTPVANQFAEELKKSGYYQNEIDMNEELDIEVFEKGFGSDEDGYDDEDGYEDEREREYEYEDERGARRRMKALRILRSALGEYKVMGVSTNIEFLRTLAGNKTFVEGHVETGFIPKHYDHLFPPLPEPSPEVLAQAALFVILHDHPAQSPAASPWTSLVSRRFGGDVYDRTVMLQTEDASAEPITVHVKSTAGGLFDIATATASGERTLTSVPACLLSPTTLSTSLDAVALCTTVVSQSPPAGVPASASPHTTERLHVFHGGHKTTLLVASPKWLVSLGGDVLGAARGALPQRRCRALWWMYTFVASAKLLYKEMNGEP